MSRAFHPTTTPPPEEEVEYPSSDGEPMGETGWHVTALLQLFAGLREHYADRPDVYVAADMFLYYERGQPSSCVCPDCMVIFGVEKDDRPSFKVWEEGGTIPSVVVEITSEKTYRVDLQRKKAVYAALGVAEYYLFDPLGERLERPFLGFQLEGGEYQARPPEPDGGLDSPTLNLRIVPEGTTLRLINLQTGQPLLTGLEKNLALQQEARRLEEERQRREGEQRLRVEEQRLRVEEQRLRVEEQRLREEEQRRRVEEQRLRVEEQRRAEQLAAEVERLRALLNQRDAGTESVGE
ncbi:hypothetical protein BH23PLA1_BH23PLA1_26330 [soil metagenome]